MRSTRDRILKTLLTHPNATISDLADAVDINMISVRHHLTNLLAAGLIVANELRHGVGRPRLVYSLSESGQENFPTRYMNLSNLLLGQLKKTLSNEEVIEVFTKIAQTIANDQIEKTRNLSFEEKLDFLKNILAGEGFMVEWEKTDGGYLIHEISCPFYHVGQMHPEVCALDQNLISSMLSIPTEKVLCVLNGDQHCAYLIRK
jgi:predicted ArsR family transcriptional regulator